jgi:glycosyltransferase involved in cell wall biosynthesis
MNTKKQICRKITHHNLIFLDKKTHKKMDELDELRIYGHNLPKKGKTGSKEAVSQSIIEDGLKNTIAVEIPYYDDIASGGINRMLKLVMELPHCNPTSGGVRENLKLGVAFSSDIIVRFQKIVDGYPQIQNKWSVGLPDNTFPPCSICITYSDNPYLSELVALPQIGRVFIYMLSYGMAIERERKNIHMPNVTVLCSTKKLERAISAEGVKVHRIGFGLDLKEMYMEKSKSRKNYLAILYAPSEEKRYSTAVSVADYLYDNKKIDGVLTFGTKYEYDKHLHPKGLIKHYMDASRDDVREIFNTCKCFLMPSISEGLNLTPIESTLCGCPAVLCDGAIDEIFFNEKNCFIAKPDDEKMMIDMLLKIMSNYEYYSQTFFKETKKIVNKYTWKEVVNNLKQVIDNT